jgi:hypothetical protein
MMIEWRKQLADIEELEVDEVNEVFYKYTDWELSDTGRLNVKKLIRRFGINEVLEATEIAIGRYYYGTNGSWNNAFAKIGGICYNRKKARGTNAEQDD